MNSRILPIAVLLALSATALPGQSGQIAGPVIGFVWDSSARALRPVLGIPGASTLGDPLGDPLNTGLALSSATVAPHQDSAIAFAADGSLHLLRLGAGVTEVLCGACPSTADAAVFSPSGTAVALYSAGRAQIVTGLPGAPVAGASFEVGASRDHALAPPLALSDDGAWLLASSRVAVNLFGSNGGPRQLLATGPGALVAFAAGSHDAAIADPSGAALMLFHDVAGESTQQALAAPDEVRQAAALAFSADGSRLFLASRADQSIAAIDIASGTSTVSACNCALSGLVSMGNVLRLNELGNGPLWLLDASGSAAPKVVFVPAAAAQ
jgi:hypothetical protein